MDKWIYNRFKMRWRISLTSIMLFLGTEMIEYQAVYYLAMKLNKRRYKRWVIDSRRRSKKLKIQQQDSFLMKAYDHGLKNQNDQRTGNMSSF